VLSALRMRTSKVAGHVRKVGRQPLDEVDVVDDGGQRDATRPRFIRVPGSREAVASARSAASPPRSTAYRYR
jgi:hypothetical protein